MSRRARFWLLLIGAVVALAAPSRAQVAPFEIYAILSMTGPGSYLGHENATGLQLVERAVNATGGVRGRPIHFVVRDDQTSPQISVQLLNELMQRRPFPAAVIGSSLVASCNAMAPLVHDGPVLYCLSPGFIPAKGSYAFSYGIPTAGIFRVMLRYFHDRGWHRLAALFTTDASGQDGIRSLNSAMALPENASMRIVDLERLNPTDVSANAEVARMKVVDPQALIVWVNGTPFGTALRATTDLGVGLPMGVSGANLNYAEMEQFASTLPPELYTVSVPGLAPDALPNGPLKKAVMRYVAAVKAAGDLGDANYINGWDPGTIIVNGYRQLGLDATPAAMQQYIENLHGWLGAGGTYDFRDGSQRGLTGEATGVVRWDAPSKRFVAASKLGGTPLGR